LCVVCRVCIMYYVVCCKGLSLVADKIGYSMKGSALYRARASAEP